MRFAVPGGSRGNRASEKRKVGGSTPPLTTHRTPAKMLLLPAETRFIHGLLQWPFMPVQIGFMTADARSLLHVGCTARSRLRPEASSPASCLPRCLAGLRLMSAAATCHRYSVGYSPVLER